MSLWDLGPKTKRYNKRCSHCFYDLGNPPGFVNCRANSRDKGQICFLLQITTSQFWKESRWKSDIIFNIVRIVRPWTCLCCYRGQSLDTRTQVTEHFQVSNKERCLRKRKEDRLSVTYIPALASTQGYSRRDPCQDKRS